VSTGDTSLIGKRNPDGADGFGTAAPAVNIPGRDTPPAQSPRYPPAPVPEQHGEAGTTTPLSPATAPAGTGSTVPACRMSGSRLDTFVLYDFDGKPWDLRKQRTGKVVLLDFWFSGCGPCRRAIPHLVELQQKYGTFGLQIVGVANEGGTLAEKQKALLPVRARFGINYTLLFAGGGDGPCPVMKEFAVVEYPTLVLLDRDGEVVFRTKKGQGLDPQAAYDLEMEIRRQLGLPLK
jgi:thiol-disulfide isomerase/thioredoxin